MVVPLAEVAQRLRHDVPQRLFEAERELLMLIMLNEAAWLSGFAEVDLNPRSRAIRKPQSSLSSRN
jgi:hypothetical protein